VHLEYLGSIKDVAKAKYELIEQLPEAGTAVLNADDAILSSWAKGLKQDVITYSIEKDADCKVESFKFGSDSSNFVINGVEFKINFLGKHNIYNAACAIAGASAFGLSIDELPGVFENIRPYSLRSEILTRNDITIINDCYNANPTSMRMAIDMLASYPIKGRRVAVLGDMLELGQDEVKYHEEIGEYLNQNKIDALFTTGNLAENFHTKYSGKFKRHFSNKNDLINELIEYLHRGDGVLIKGSRRIALENVTAELMRSI
jgi:UDP-N-acetylmuramoyl-tripeptide--D-alanyl-D-alanine ligase